MILVQTVTSLIEIKWINRSNLVEIEGILRRLEESIVVSIYILKDLSRRKRSKQTLTFLETGVRQVLPYGVLVTSSEWCVLCWSHVDIVVVILTDQ